MVATPRSEPTAPTGFTINQGEELGSSTSLVTVEAHHDHIGRAERRLRLPQRHPGRGPRPGRRDPRRHWHGQRDAGGTCPDRSLLHSAKD